MGLYLLIICYHDFKYRDTYNMQAQGWMSSWLCTAAGVLGMASSEISIFLLLYISIERFFVIAVSFGRYESVTRKTSVTGLVAIWGLGIALAVTPGTHSNRLVFNVIFKSF